MYFTAVRVTKEAARQLSLRGSSFLFSCKYGGCNGFEYVLEQSTGETNVELQQLDNGVDLCICNVSMFIGYPVWTDSQIGPIR